MISAPELEHWDRCRRQWTYLSQYQAKRVTPLGAVYQALHLCLTTGKTEYPGPKLAREWMMDVAGKRGVQTDRPDPYDVMVNYAHLAECLARVLRQPETDALQLHKPVGEWKPESYLVDGGMRLMRVVLADRWDDDRQLAELHSWRTIGDVCVTGLPMTLRVLVIGPSMHGRRYCHWTRARQHPYDKTVRFKRRNQIKEGEFQATGWKTVWREDTLIGPDGWIERMAKDGVLKESAFDVRVKVPDEYQRGRVLDDIKRIAVEMDKARKLNIGFPMTRSACDDPIHGACRLQECCFAARETTPEETGLFVLKGGNSNGKP